MEGMEGEGKGKEGEKLLFNHCSWRCYLAT